jgi:hypothetical protein
VVHERDEREDFPPALEETPRRDFEPDLDAFLAVFRLVPLLAPALRDFLRFVEVWLRVAADFFFFPALLCELLLIPEAAPMTAPDTAPATAPAIARLKTPPVFSSACAAVSAMASRAFLDAIFLFTIC